MIIESHVHMPRRIDDSAYCHAARSRVTRVFGSPCNSFLAYLSLPDHPYGSNWIIICRCSWRKATMQICGSRSCSRWRIGKLLTQSSLTQVRNRVALRHVSRHATYQYAWKLQKRVVHSATISCSGKRVIGQSPPESLSSIDGTCAIV